MNKLAYERSYTQAIDSIPDKSNTLVRDIYRKRAYANLIDGRCEAAMEDALASCSGDLNDKAHHCVGCAAYELGHYEIAKDHFVDAVQACPKNIRYQKDLARSKVRIHYTPKISINQLLIVIG